MLLGSGGGARVLCCSFGAKEAGAGMVWFQESEAQFVIKGLSPPQPESPEATAPTKLGPRSGRPEMENYLSPVSFWDPALIDASAWIEHAPFAFWITSVLQPRSFVELGTQNGYSYFAFCQAVKALGLDTRCYAVDTWKGDVHAGPYGEEVFCRVRDRNSTYYNAFSRLIRSTFDQALTHFNDASIDLLHIDGQHFYDDVKHDFESWQPKLSDRAVVLFHDTNVREQNFGVFRLWEELRGDYPSFEFLHGHGLGVLGHGRALANEVKAFFDAVLEPHPTATVRSAYACLGERLSTTFRQQRCEAVAADLRARVEARDAEARELARQVAELARQVAASSAKAKEISAKRAELEVKVGQLRSKVSRLKASRSWRITAPIRMVSRRLWQVLKRT